MDTRDDAVRLRVGAGGAGIDAVEVDVRAGQAGAGGRFVARPIRRGPVEDDDDARRVSAGPGLDARDSGGRSEACVDRRAPGHGARPFEIFVDCLQLDGFLVPLLERPPGILAFVSPLR